MDFIFIAAAAAVIAAISLRGLSKPAIPVTDIGTMAPPVLRTDLMYGYYGVMGNQVAETSSHTNVHWECQFEGEPIAIQNIIAASRTTVLDCSRQLMYPIVTNGKALYYFDAVNGEQRLRNWFTNLRTNGVLHYIFAITIIDEPNINAASASEVQLAIDAVRRVASNFTELSNVKLAVIYAGKPRTFECFDQFDLIGVDDYDLKSRIFVDGTYAAIKSRLAPHQRTIIMPGGGFGQDPIPFFDFAEANSEVSMVLAFVWFGGRGPGDAWVGIGDNANPLKQSYINMGSRIIAGPV